MNTWKQKRWKQSRKSEGPTLIAPKIFLLEKVLIPSASGMILAHPFAPAKSQRKRTSPALLTFCKWCQHVKVILFIWFYFPCESPDSLKVIAWLQAMKSLQPNSLQNETWATFWLHFKLHLQSVSQAPKGKWKHFHALQKPWAWSQPLNPAVPMPSAAPTRAGTPGTKCWQSCV